MVMTLEADYAVRIVEMLSMTQSRIDAHTISEETQVPLRFALKILRKLVAGGLVLSYKGARGGYTLARKPGEITLRQVIESVEGPYMISRCQQEEYDCAKTSCRFYRIYDEISAVVREKLDSYTFESIDSGTQAQK
ncbi:RrF2 family transcriptional regulator [Caproiciproducens sp. LBM24188]|nr:Rrf2 family transcriptional regulator [Oscillospiraceae bacterium]HHV32077.1 Rrf2 family transcriptional regulator [Clostridiales bacterium]